MRRAEYGKSAPLPDWQDALCKKMENGRFAQRLSPEDPIKEESVNPSIRIESKKNSVYDISLTSN